MFVFYFFAAVVIGQGILSLRSGFSFTRYVRTQIAKNLSAYSPFVSVIAPCRGLEPNLKDNLSALFQQDYPAYEIIFVTDQEDDPSTRVIEDTIRGNVRPDIRAQVVVAGEATDCGQKVHNLKTAATRVDTRCEVLVFVDSDARTYSGWLRSLVSPLRDPATGAATGYRWFVAADGGCASHLRSVWNASITSALGERSDKNFVWGGSTAIRRDTFENLRVLEAWHGTVSDDFALTNVLQRAKLPIHFVPACLVPSPGDCSFKELLEFTNRQLKITRVYAPHLWRLLLIGSLLFVAVFFGGLGMVAVRAFLGFDYAIALLLLAGIFILGSAKAYIRWKAVALVLSSQQNLTPRALMAHLLLWPLASLLFLWNAIVAGFSRRIVWRGITYELKSATEAVIIRRE